MSDATEILVMFMTDVEGSTSLWQQRRKEMLPTLDHLDTVVERVMRGCAPGKTMLSPAAATVLAVADDLVVGTMA